MELFISWSGSRSKAAAEALRNWLPKLINAVQPWLSSADIDRGARWGIDIATRLANTSFGILCLTPGNVHSDWIIFEAGALSKTIEKTFVCPLLFGLEPSDITGPLAQFQTTCATRDDMRALLTTMNRAQGTEALTEQHLDDAFEVWWPRLDAQFAKLPAEGDTETKPKRTERDMLEEILALVRSEARSAKPKSPPDLDASDVLELVRRTVWRWGIVPQSVEPIYSRMPPPPDEPHVVRVRSSSGKTYVLRTPMDMGRNVVKSLIEADLQREEEPEKETNRTSVIVPGAS